MKATLLKAPLHQALGLDESVSDLQTRLRTVMPPLVRLCTPFLVGVLALPGCSKPESAESRRSDEGAVRPIVQGASGTFGMRALVGITFGQTNQEDGLHLIDGGDGVTFPAEAGGLECRQLARASENYLYLAIDPAFKETNWMDVLVTVEFYAPERGLFDIQYDGRKATAGSGAYSDTPAGVQFDGAGYWNKGAVVARGARFENRQNGGADLRLRVLCPVFYVRRITVSREPTEGGF